MAEKAQQKQDESELNPFINSDEKRTTKAKKDYNGKDAERSNCKTTDSSSDGRFKCTEKNAALFRNGAIICVLVVILLIIILSAIIYFIYRVNGQLIGDVSLAVRPVTRKAANSVPLIWFESYKRWQKSSDNLNEFLSPYRNLADSYQYVYGSHNNCSGIFQNPNRFSSIEHYYYCLLKSDVTDHQCKETDGYGYRDGQPCVAIQLNHKPNWRPVAYNDTDLLVNSTIAVPDIVREGYARNDTRMIYLTCFGTRGGDKENMGPIVYFPSQAIPFEYFSAFANRTNYLPPFVFAKFSLPIRGIVISVTCRIWVKNSSESTVMFDLLDDSF